MRHHTASILTLLLAACASKPPVVAPPPTTLQSVSVHGPALDLDWALTLRGFSGQPLHQRTLANIEATVTTAYEWAEWREVLAVAEPALDESGTLRVSVYAQAPLAAPRPAAEWIVPADEDPPPAPSAAGGARAESVLDAALGQWLQTPSRVLIDGGERRLYLRRSDGKVVSYAVAVGTARTPTPPGTYTVEALRKHPTWYPPASIRRSYAAKGKTLPASVPPGPGNPLGEWFVRLQNGIGIHGTNQPRSIGRAVSHGCVRMHDRDVAELVRQLKPGDGVTVVRARSALLAGP